MAPKKLILLIICITPFFVQAQKEVEIINRYLESIGGIEKWQQLKTKIEENQSRYLEIKKAPDKNDISVLPFYLNKEYTQYSPFMRVKEVYRNNKIFSKIFCHGETMYFKYPNMQAEASYEPCDTTVSALELYEILKESSSDYLKYIGRKKMGEATYDVVQVFYREYSLNEYFNVQNGLREYSFPPDDSTRYTKYEDYREVEGLKFPFKYHSVTNGIRFFELEILKLELNNVIKEEKFEIPKKP